MQRRMSIRLYRMSYLWLLLFSLFLRSPALVLESQNGKLTINESNAYAYVLEANGKIVLQGQLGVSLPLAVGEATQNCDRGDADVCLEWGDFARVYLTLPGGENNNCGSVEWYSAYARRLEDCFDLLEGVHWYGGAETRVQTWPIETVARDEAAYVTGDFSATQFGGLLEAYWLTTSGAVVHVEEGAPLFTSWNTTQPGKFCLVAQDRNPYPERPDLKFRYEVCVPKPGETFKDVHIRSLRKYYNLARQLPDEDMLVYPLWSTWAEYKTNVSQGLVLQLAQRIISEGYTRNSHIEIDDNWETCYGDATFDPHKFPDPAGMVASLQEIGINRTTLWIHPFINRECPAYQTAFKKGYFVKNSRSHQALTAWWEGGEAGVVDFSNPAAVTWWRGRLQNIQRDFGITSFKFDAGETYWLPPSVHFQGDPLLLPNILSTKYIEAVSQFGGMVEVRTGHRNQNLPIFTRMLDKDSIWSNANGLRSLIPTLLLFSILGYSYVLPDLIGGNAYGALPSNELYIRWAQANIFMPAWQFSILPWDVDPTRERDRIVKAAVDLRIRHSSKFIEAARQTLIDGAPINRPLWWVDPEDPATYRIGDQYMLGDDILVAPVVTQGATSRDIYLPRGAWAAERNGREYTFEGPTWLRNWSAPLDCLPFFVRQTNDI